MWTTGIFHRHRKYAEMVDAFVDAELRDGDARRFTAHLETCARCSDAVAAARQFKAALKAVPEAPAPRSFRITPAMLAGSQGSAVPARTGVPLYMNLARAGAALSVVAFASVVAFGAFDSPPSGDDDSSAASGSSLEYAAPGAATAMSDKSSPEPTPALAPASGGEVVVSGSATVAVLASVTPPPPAQGGGQLATPVPPRTGPQETPAPQQSIPQPPSTGAGSTPGAAETNGDDASRNSPAPEGSPLSSIGVEAFDPTEADNDDEESKTLTVVLGAVAAAAVLGVLALEITRRTRNA